MRLIGARRRYKYYWKEGDGSGGVGVMVKEQVIEQARRKNCRGIVVVLLIEKETVSVISVYALQQGRDNEKTVKF